jgi:hypothetical protein
VGSDGGMAQAPGNGARRYGGWRTWRAGSRRSGARRGEHMGQGARIGVG